MNRVLLILIIAVSLASCKSDENKIKEIIDESYFGVHHIKKMKDLNIIENDIYNLPTHHSIVTKILGNKIEKLDQDNDYFVTRHIYKTSKGVFRIFYLVDLTNEVILKKSSDYNDFYLPIVHEILGNKHDDSILGNSKIELMKY